MSTIQLADDHELKRYYRFHSHIYDVTRWSFLFGRQKIIKIAANHVTPLRILEVGCGTGSNLRVLLKRFPHAHVTGVDLSREMLKKAENKLLAYQDRITLIEQSYDRPLCNTDGKKTDYDLVLFSYALSMFNPGWEVAIESARKQLSEKGIIAIVDFHYSRFDNFRRWMQMNHVKMERHLLTMLEFRFNTLESRTVQAYGNAWKYFFYIGKNGE